MSAKDEMYICPICEMVFPPKRTDAIYCSSKCRVKAHRKGVNRTKSKEQTDYRIITNKLYDMQAVGKQRTLRSIALQAIELMDDEQRAKLYDQIKDDMYRVAH